MIFFIYRDRELDLSKNEKYTLCMFLSFFLVFSVKFIFSFSIGKRMVGEEEEEEECFRYVVQYKGLFKVGTFILFITSMLILMTIYFLCPFNRKRKKLVKKKYLDTFYDTRSISADTEFDFKPGVKDGKSLSKSYPSILKMESNFKNGGIATTSEDLATKKNTFALVGGEINNAMNNNPTIHKPLLNNLNNMSSLTDSRVQLKDRMAPLNVSFNLRNENSNVSKRCDSGVTSSLSRHHYQHATKKENFAKPKLQKRFSSSQDLSFRDRGKKVFPGQRDSIQKCSSYSSAPDFNVFQRLELPQHCVSRKGSLRTPDINRKHQDPYEISGLPVSADDTDEGQMQCTMGYDSLRSLIVIKNLEIQARFPTGVQGFIVEVHIAPNTSQVVRSKVYVTHASDVSIRLNEIFHVKCNRGDMSESSVVISVIPVIGNLILFAETDLNEIDYLEHGEMNLGGFLKGVYKQI